MSGNPYQSPQETGDSASQPVRLPDGRHEYLLTGRTPDGQEVTERVEAASADAAVAQFRGRGHGYVDVVLHTDEVMSLFPGQSAVAEVFTPQEYVELLKAGTFWRSTWFMLCKVYRKAWGTDALLLGCLALRRWAGWPWGVWDWVLLAALLAPLALILLRLAFSPSRRYNRLIAADAWGQWDDVLRQVDSLEGRVPAHDLALRKAKALAGLGRLDEALRVIGKVAHDPQVPPWMYQDFVGEVYSVAKKFDEATIAAERAVELAPDNATVLLDLALGLLTHRRNVERARQLLRQVESHALSDLLVPVFEMAQGLLALEDGHAQQAKARLEKAVAGISPFRAASPLVGSLEDKMRAYLALAAASAGDADAALRNFRAAEPRLRALRSDELLARCQQALARLGVQTASSDSFRG